MELVIRGLSKTYPNGVQALRDVSLTIPRGMFGLLGPNGAGKSTLMRILATLQEADAGSVRLGELDVLRDHEAVRRTLGYLPQEFGLYPKATAEETLDHFALLKGVADRRERRELVDALLEQTNLSHARRRMLGGFSGGMKQRFGIAVALIGRPRLIIVDEPTAGLDPEERVRFLNLLADLGRDAVVILSTHIVQDVAELCTRMAVIVGGRILLESEPAEAVEALRGRLWRREADAVEVEALGAEHPVISTRMVAGRTLLHVHGGAPPGPGWEPVEPELMDVYMASVRGVPVFAAPDAASPSAEDGERVGDAAAPTGAPAPGDARLSADPGDETEDAGPPLAEVEAADAERGTGER